MRWAIGGVLVVLAAAGSTVRGEELYPRDQSGTLVTVGNDGALGRLPGATVKLRCHQKAAPSDRNHWHLRCATRLTVEVGGRVVARLDDTQLDIDFAQVAGNHAELELSLLQFDGDASLVHLHRAQMVGDLHMRVDSDERYYAVQAGTLRLVAASSGSGDRPGPDERGEAREEHFELSIDAARTRGWPNLVFTRLVDGNPGAVSVQRWNGGSYWPCNECRPTQPATFAPPVAASPVTQPSTPADASDALVARVLAGQRVAAADLASLPSEALTRLRNAPYARHGRAFKTPSLQAYFYGARAPGSPLPPLAVDPSFQESRLDGDDQGNLATVLAEIRRRGAAH